MKRKVNLNFRFVIPVEEVLGHAQRMAKSVEVDEQTVGKAVVEVTEISQSLQAILARNADDEVCDLKPYFDYPFGDILAAANRLKESQNKNTANVAKTLLLGPA